MRAAAVWRDTAQSTTERLWEENLGKDLTHPSATAKTTGTGTTTDQTAGTETNKTGEGRRLQECCFQGQIKHCYCHIISATSALVLPENVNLCKHLPNIKFNFV